MEADIDFNLIIPRLGSKRDAFEELCCQLASRAITTPIVRLHGAGGDGGVECFSDHADGRVGWQAKYVFTISSLLTQADKSLKKALQIHPTLTRFVLCFPFDLTGPTGRRGHSSSVKLANWIKDQVRLAKDDGRELAIEPWPAAKVRSLLMEHDPSGGVRHFFFGTTWLDDAWFTTHLSRAFATAGPRYTPEVNVPVGLRNWVAGLGREASWESATETNIEAPREAIRQLQYALDEPRDYEDRRVTWPNDTLNATKSLVTRLCGVLDQLKRPPSVRRSQYEVCISNLNEVARELRSIEMALFREVEERHGPGTADSPGWRHRMAEYMVTFPAAHLDGVRALAGAVETLGAWLQSPESCLAYEHVLVVTGDPGSGKTHGICDATANRNEAGLRTCIVFGHQFDGQPDPWARIAESLGISASLGADKTLDCLDSAGEASGYPLLLCIDAINETKPLSYWRNYIPSLADAVQARPNLRLCLVCKSTFLSQCLPEAHAFKIATHRGFAGVERLACQTYFSHYGLRPPIAPILQPELSNALYLRLACETLRAQGLDRLPAGWTGGGVELVRRFLQQKAVRFAVDFETVREGASTSCLVKLVQEIVASGNTSVSWSAARNALATEVSDPDAALSWLVREGLLIEDVAEQEGWLQEPVIRPAFERLGDFLIANELIEQIADEDARAASRPGGAINPWLQDLAAIETNKGMLAEFSVLVAERSPSLELPDLGAEPATKERLTEITVAALRYRSPASLTSATAHLVRDHLAKPASAYEAMDAVLGCSWRPSPIDAMWLHDLLEALSMSDRDAFWCQYLYDRFGTGIVKNYIESAHELPLGDLEPDVADRWVTALLWFTAAADRRIKDGATRAVVRLLAETASVIPSVLERFLSVNDDEVRERTLLCIYGALLMTATPDMLTQVADFLCTRYVQQPGSFNNAVIRDHIRCICELRVEFLGDASPGIHPTTITDKPASAEWPLAIPTDEEVDNWEDALRFDPV